MRYAGLAVLLIAGCQGKVSEPVARVEQDLFKVDWEVTRASWGDPGTDTEDELRERSRIHERLSERLADLDARIERELQRDPSIEDLERVKDIRARLQRARATLEEVAGKVARARERFGKP